MLPELFYQLLCSISAVFYCFFFFCSGVDVNHNTGTNDHTVLSLASAGGHLAVVQYLLMQGADPSYVLKVSHCKKNTNNNVLL